nr:MAG TPA: Recombination endonuclease VII [Caudoviricetes sp.]
MATKLKTSEVEAYKRELLEKQGWKCPICGAHLKAVSPINRVLDHCHRRGFCRAVLCRGCNGGIGKIENLVKSYCKAGDNEYFIVKTLRNIAAYLDLHKTPQTDKLYHKHQTEAEKREARNRKARLAYARKKEGKVG